MYTRRNYFLTDDIRLEIRSKLNFFTKHQLSLPAKIVSSWLQQKNCWSKSMDWVCGKSFRQNCGVGRLEKFSAAQKFIHEASGEKWWINWTSTGARKDSCPSVTQAVFPSTFSRSTIFFTASALSHRINVLLRLKLELAVEMLKVIYHPRPIAFSTSPTQPDPPVAGK